MAYTATVIQVMIASPGDVNEERDEIRRARHVWNANNCRETKVALMPVGWETHAAPDLAGRAQGLINDRLLDGCDLLVGVFWTRLGTPTGEHASGTVEEIKRHVDAGRTAMVYFSSKPVVPGSYSADQFEKVIEFKAWCQARGLTKDFDSVADFRDKFSNDLQRIIWDSPYLRSLLPDLESAENSSSSDLQTVKLDEIAVRMLQTAVHSRSAMILVHKMMDGTHFQAGDNTFDSGGSQREMARLQAAVESLEKYGLIKDVGYKGEVFEVTHEGYEAVDRYERS